jgi:glucose/arabinose dehydrogenase
MKLLLRLGAIAVVLLVVLFLFIWLTVPLNVPWRSMLQQAGVLPRWLDPQPMTVVRMVERLRVPEGYGLGLFAEGVTEARGLTVTVVGDVLVSTPRDGRVLLLHADTDADGEADGQSVLLDGLARPNGLAVRDGYLYVGEEDGVGRVPFDVETGSTTGEYRRIIEGLPPGGNHWKKTIRFGVDGLLYLAVGSSCNVCIEEDSRRGAILRYTAEGEFVDIFATGLRNSGGFDWSPATGTLYATDNGRDLLGDEFPPCELNEVVAGGFYGWPFVNGRNVPDPDFGDVQSAVMEAAIPPVHEFQPHNAPLGIVFFRHDRHPPEYRGAAAVALHGSWNRSEKDGYKVVSLHFASDGSIEERDFLTGFLVNDEAIGRPADVAEGPDGSVYVSDDLGGAVYRIRFNTVTDKTLTVSTPRPSSGYDSRVIGAEERQNALAIGSSILADKDCLVCHARADEQADDRFVLRDLRTKYTVDELSAFLVSPRQPMPPYEADRESRRALAIFLLESF